MFVYPKNQEKLINLLNFLKNNKIKYKVLGNGSNTLFSDNEYDGVISSITSFGVFVELENTVEGLIRFENLGDEYFIYNDERKILVGEHTNKVYKIGQCVKIRVIEANKELRRISFEIIENG